MSSNKTVIVVWDTDNYLSRQAADADGAVYEHVIPEFIGAQNIQDYIDAFVCGLCAAGERLKANNQVLQYEVVEFKPFTVSGRVLEWNAYTATVWAEDSHKAEQQANEDGILSYSSKNVEWGVDSAPDGVVDTQPIHIVVQVILMFELLFIGLFVVCFYRWRLEKEVTKI